MKAQKNLTNEQRKILDKIYSRQFSDVRGEYRRKRQDEYDTMHKELLDKAEAKATSNPKAKALLKETQAFIAKFERTNRELERAGINIGGVSTYGNDVRIKFERYQFIDDRLTNHSNETQSRLSAMDKAWLEVQAKIWGMETTYSDIVRDVESVLSSIK